MRLFNIIRLTAHIVTFKILELLNNMLVNRNTMTHKTNSGKPQHVRSDH